MSFTSKAEIKKILIVITILLMLLAGVFILRRKRAQEVEKLLNGQSVKKTKLNIPVQSTPKLVEKGKGRYKIELSRASAQVNETVLAKVIFEAPESIITGTDIHLSFDPDILYADSNIVYGDYFASFPRSTVDNAKGEIKITGFRAKEEIPKESVLVLTISFYTQKQGEAKIDFDFIPGESNKTTLVEKGSSKNILGEVVGASLRVN